MHWLSVQYMLICLHNINKMPTFDYHITLGLVYTVELNDCDLDDKWLQSMQNSMQNCATAYNNTSNLVKPF